MPTSEDDALRSVAESLVQRLTHPDSGRMFDFFGPGRSVQVDAPLVSATPGWVGIWQRGETDASYHRSVERRGEWGLWADILSIPPKGARKRVAYIGESVARGYFYDPAFTPAQVLQCLLDSVGIPDGAEVIDLARSDLAFEGDLFGLIESARALEPDAYVIFAGNNRKLPRSVLKEPPSRPAVIAEVLRSSGIAGVSQLTAGWRRREADKVIQALAGLGAPVVTVIPEFNLGDWTHETTGDLPWLPGDDCRRWFEHLDRAQRALRRGETVEAEAQAQEMIRLDQGLASSGLAIMGECMRRKGDLASMRDFTRRARDAHVGWDFGSPETPRLDRVTASALRQGLDRAGIAYVDCAEVFAEHLDGEPPDRKMFLDYCHLTSDGIRLTMAQVAGRLAQLLDGDIKAPAALFDAAPSPSPQDESLAHFAAAIHNAHWGQPFDIVHHHCIRAFDLAPHLAPVFEEYMHMATCRTPNWMCRHMEPLLRKDCTALVKYVLSYGAVSLVDETLTEAIAEAVEDRSPGAKARLAELRLREYGLVPEEAEDLLAIEYAPSFMDREWSHSGFYGAVETRRRPVFRFLAHAPRSRFVFVCNGLDSVQLQMTFRLVDAQSPGVVQVSINGQRTDALAATRDWRVADLAIDADHLVAGVNEIQIRWPEALTSGEDAIRKIADRTEHRLGSVQLSPVYGMIHSLTAKTRLEQPHD
jgi:hypothetical protein